MTVAFFALASFTLISQYRAIRQVRALRRQLERNNAQVFKAQVRRAECWERFCPSCKKIAAPWWKPPVTAETEADPALFSYDDRKANLDGTRT